MKALIFTDMDGTLLDHHTYSYEPASHMLEHIKKKGIPLILTTSKTRSEVIKWQQRLGIVEPFITENGAAIFFPEGYRDFDLNAYPLMDGFRVVSLGKPYAFVVKYLSSVLDKYAITGFAQMSPQEVMEATGLSYDNALLAKARDFTEPFIMQDPDLVPILQEEAKLYGLKITKGGRFFHCIGMGQDKGMAVRTACAIFRRNGYEATSLALGDGKNDEAMLSVVDTPIQIPHPDGTFVTMDVANIIQAAYPGPKGWADALEHILTQNN